MGIIRLGVLLFSLSNTSSSSVPKVIRILGLFDDPNYGGDPIHEMGFLAAIDTINENRDMNQDGHITLGGTTIEPVILHIPPGARYMKYFEYPSIKQN
jgi:hypothetical protein